MPQNPNKQIGCHPLKVRFAARETRQGLTKPVSSIMIWISVWGPLHKCKHTEFLLKNHFTAFFSFSIEDKCYYG